MNNERLEVVLPHGRRDHPVQVPPVARWERSFLTKVKLLRVTGTYPPRYTQKIEFDMPPSTTRLWPVTSLDCALQNIATSVPKSSASPNLPAGMAASLTRSEEHTSAPQPLMRTTSAAS